VVDPETVKLLGAALGSVKTIADIAGTITNVKLRQELNGQIADLQNAIFTARQKLLDMQEQYERLLHENKQLKAKLADTVEADPCPSCHRKGWHVVSSEADSMFGELGAFRRLYKCEFCAFSESQLITAK
jgi:hypothetical protein